MITPFYKITYSYQNKRKCLYVKDESRQVTGSIKYRPATYMVRKAYELKLIDASSTLVEVTSGNMGIALAKVAKDLGNKLVIYMPVDASKERKKMITDLGAKLVLVKDFADGLTKASQHKDAYYLRQFENQYNADAYVAFAQEMEFKLKKYPAFVASVGTSGTLMGTGSYLKRKYQSKIIAVEPSESLLFSTGVSHGPHGIAGVADGFIPKIYKKDLVDQVISVSTDDAIAMAQKLRDVLKLEIGISSGANFLGTVLSEINHAVTVFPDRMNRYYSTRLFKEKVYSRLVESITLEKIEKL
ncbi:MAG: cysteine synthase family protein [Bacilli bacterium]|nr:cysteine synthase family protein [Bacilli bacterium]